ncbi:MAG: hypothetical protein ACJ764_11480 [Solirubrobacteraceae bacterium]
MRRYITAICVVGLIGAGAAATALAARPLPNRGYSGNGVDSWNRGGGWVRHGTGSFQFTTSKKYYYRNKPYWYLTNFTGSYTTPCNGGTLHVHAFSVVIHANGTFSHTFHKRNATFTLWGSFTSRHVAKVNYLVRFSSSCQSRVQGKAFAG